MAIQPLPVISDIQTTGTLTSTSSSVTLECNGISSGKILVSGTWVGTIKLQQSVDLTRWDDVVTFSETTGSILLGTGITSNDLISFIGIGGTARIRAVFTSYTSGTATVTIRASAGVGHIDQADGPVTPGTVAVKSSLIGGQYNTSLPTLTNTQQVALQVDSSGRLFVNPGNITTLVPKISKKMRAIFDTNNQTVTGSSFTTIYSYSGSGDFWGCMIDTNQNGSQLRIEIDGEVIIDGTASVTDIQFSQSLLTTQNYAGGQWYQSMDFGDFSFSLPYPISYTSSVVIKLKRDNNGSVTMNQMWIYLTKET